MGKGLNSWQGQLGVGTGGLGGVGVQRGERVINAVGWQVLGGHHTSCGQACRHIDGEKRLDDIG